MRDFIRVAAVVLSGLVALPALAQPRPVRIEQVMAGAFGRPEIQFIELRADLCSSSWPAAAQLTFRTATGAPAGVFAFPSAPAGGCPGPTSILVGTPAFAALGSAPDPDFLMPPLLLPDSGLVCLEAPGLNFPPCLSYGSFSSSSFPFLLPNAPTLPVHGICALRHNNPIVPLREMSNLDFDLLPPVPVNSAGEAGIVTVPPRFQDVPAASPFQPFVEALFNAGISGGCGAASFCPQALVTREQMAVFLSLARHGRSFQPPACTSPLFADVPCSRPLAPWINDFFARGFSGGCGDGNFCPESPVRREEMAVFLLLVREGAGYQPPACTVPAFADVPCSDPFAPWVNELAARGITGGCAPGQFCPDDFVRRDQMAVFLSAAFGLPVPTRECRVPAVADDHGDSIATATLVPADPAGIVIDGRLERRRDVDFFAFDAQAGDLFTFRFDSGVPLAGFHGSLGILDAGGTILGGISLPNILSFTAPHTGRFFFLMRDSANRSIGNYQIFFRGPIQDDVGTGPDEAAPLILNDSPVRGEIESPGDVDAYFFEVVAGGLYVVETGGSDSRMNTFLTIVDLAGNIVNLFNGQLGPVESFLFTAPSTGRFLILVSHAENGTGRYDLRVRGPMADDHGDTPATATPLPAGDPGVPADGEILPMTDVDFFSFSGAAEDIFLLRLQSISGRVGFEVAVLDSDGVVLLDLDNRFRELDRVAVVLPEAGSYFIRVRRLVNFHQAAPYRLTLSGPVADDHGDTLATATALALGDPPTDGLLEVPADVDFFSVALTAGELFLVEVSGSPATPARLDVFKPDGSPLGSTENGELVGFVAPSAGTYFARVRRELFSVPLAYRIQVRGPLTDVGARPSMSTPLVPNAPPVSSALELRGDVDLYSFAATAGETLLLRVSGPAFLDSFSNARLEVLDTDGLTVLQPAVARFLAGTTEVWFQAPRTGTFYARVSAQRTLSYEISLQGPLVDDHGNTPATATPLVLGAPPTDGEIETNPDFDLFFFDATAGQVLIVETSDLGSGLDTLLDVLTADGFTQLAMDDDSAGNLASRIRFVVPSTGRYLVRVRPFGSTAGTYRVSAAEE